MSTIQAHDTMPEAARKILLRFYTDMRDQEPVATLGEDIEGVHKMRVATRRMRSLYKAIGDYMPPNYHHLIPEWLGMTARILGEVRDLDVMGEWINAYVQTHLNGDATPLQALLNFNAERHAIARTKMLGYFASNEYKNFIKTMDALLVKPASIEHIPEPNSTPLSPSTFRVDHLLPGIVYGRYRRVRRHETRFPHQEADELHRIRIECKRLRYTLEAFSEVLGRSGERVIGHVKALQDHLGELNDMATIMRYLDHAELLEYPAVAAWHAECAARRDDLTARFPAAWAQFTSYPVRRDLALAVAVL